ncbi:MAG: hypothetical protein ABR928_04685 [Terracidiphilus sp.]|jgi:hypothetical protein
MRFKVRSAAAALALVAVCFFCFHHPRTLFAAEQGTPVVATRMYTGADGLTHIDQIEVKMKASPEFTPEAGNTGVTELSESVPASKVFVVRSNPGFFETWHCADVRRYVVTLSGRAEIDASDGQKDYAEPGNLVLAEDLTGKGHTFRIVSKDQWVALFVDFAP